MDKTEFIIGLSITICALSLMWIQSDVKTCMDSGIGCRSFEESFFVVAPGLLFFGLFIFGLFVMYYSVKGEVF